MSLYLATNKSLREQQIRQITGVPYPVFISLLKRLREAQGARRGRPQKHAPFIELLVALLTLRHDLTLRAVEALTGLDHVTVMRICDRVVAALGDLRKARREAPHWITHLGAACGRPVPGQACLSRQGLCWRLARGGRVD